MTETKISQAVKAGLGQGRDDRYKSWIRVRRNTHSPVSNLQTMHVPLYVREVHLLSGLEFQAAAVGFWLSPAEGREQMPCWPHEHPHPNCGLHPDLDRQQPRIRGLTEIAKDAGIDHGVYPGTKIPFVATMDFTWAVGPWAQRRLINWGCKPAEFLRPEGKNSRVLERIELERLYSHETGATYRTVTGDEWSPHLAANLEWLMPLHSENKDPGNRAQAEEFALAFMEIGEGDSIRNAKAYAAQKLALCQRRRNDLFRLATWLGYIPLDLSLPVVMSRPMKRDVAYKDELRRRLYGS